MAYIGKAPNTAIVNQATSQSFSGNGSTTAFTLTRSVNVGEDLEVFVNNVQQEPGSGKSYTASGTTLTFDEAPPSGTNNVYVIYRGEATINPRLEHDANAALAATTGTFSGDLTVDTNTLHVDAANNSVGIGTTSPGFSNGSGLEVANATTACVRIEGNSAAHAVEIYADSSGGTIDARGTGAILAFDIGGSEAARIDASGHVGINNTTPASYLEGELVVGNSTKDQYINVVTGTGNAAGLCFQDTTGTSIVGGLRYTHSDNALASWTNGSERMRINSNGTIISQNVGSTSANLEINGASTNGHYNILMNGDSGNGYKVAFKHGSSVVGTIITTSSNTSFNTSSDARLKENVADMTDAIARVKQLSPKRFSWIVDKLDAANVDGFLAHEAQAVVPEAVTGTKDEVDEDGNAVMQGIDQSKLVPLLTGALQEAIAKIETLEAKVAALEK